MQSRPTSGTEEYGHWAVGFALEETLDQFLMTMQVSIKYI